MGGDLWDGALPAGALALALVPLGLILVTSFIKLSVVLSFLRRALGAPEIPSTAIVVAVSALMSAFIMAPVALETVRAIEGLPTSPAPLEEELVGPQPDSVAAQVDRLKAAASVFEPLKAWLGRHSGQAERQSFVTLGKALHPKEDHGWLLSDDSPLVLLPAFVMTELKEAFIIGFVIFVPFMVLELVVANTLLSLNMHMVNPATISLPFKLLLFVLIDGWRLLIEGLILGYV